MSHSSPRTINLQITDTDASLILVALWMRCRDAANRYDYVALRETLSTQLHEQGIDVEPLTTLAVAAARRAPRLWRLLYEDEAGRCDQLGELLHEGPRAAATVALMMMYWDDRMDGVGCTPIVQECSGDEDGADAAHESGCFVPHGIPCAKCAELVDDVGDCPDGCPQPWH